MAAAISPNPGITERNVSLSQSIGDATQVTLMLSDWKNYGLSERCSLHLDLLETLGGVSGSTNNSEMSTKATKTDHQDDATASQRNRLVCGVRSVLECVPSLPWKDLNKKQKKDFRFSMKEFNQDAEQARHDGSRSYYQPTRLPLPLSPSSRMSFVYDMTRMVFIVDASPTLVSSFGVSDSEDYSCPLDRLSDMARTFFEALAQKSSGLSMARSVAPDWRSSLCVTVLAVYPGAMSKDANVSILVRDYRVDSFEDATVLADNFQQWLMGDVECEIAKRLNSGGLPGKVGFDSWVIPKYTTNLKDILRAGDVALDFLPSRARPCFVVATDCRSVIHTEIMSLLSHEERIDVPIHILDVSSPSSHIPPEAQSYLEGTTSESRFLVRDPGGPATFPLHMSDDSEALYAIARATNGCFLDHELLALTASTTLSQVPLASPLALDPYLSFKRRALRPNALQWYIFFSMSPLTPSTLSQLAANKLNSQHPMLPAGKLVPPAHLRQRMGLLNPQSSAESKEKEINAAAGSVLVLLRRQRDEENQKRRSPCHKATFSTYVVEPVRVKSLLLARIKEGYRAKLYGASTQDLDKISIQLSLPIEYGTVIHYELQFKAKGSHNAFVGVAHVKIEVSGERLYIESLKHDFLANSSTRDESVQLCKVLRWIRYEDLLQSFLSPLRWHDELSSPSTPFARRLGSLSRQQRLRNFRIDQFDAVCTGRMPFAHDGALPFIAFIDKDNGERELFDALTHWSTQTIKPRRRFVKQLCTTDSLTAYTMVEVCQSVLASRLFTIIVHTPEGMSLQLRLSLLDDLKTKLAKPKDVCVLPKQMYRSLAGVMRTPDEASWLHSNQILLESHFDNEEWQLVRDPELVDLLMRRRIELGKFFLLSSSDSHALFAIDISIKTGKPTLEPHEEVYLVQYQIALRGAEKTPVVNMHVEKEVGFFHNDSRRGIGEHLTRAHRTFVRIKSRDRQCSYALNSRTRMMGLLDSSSDKSYTTTDQLNDITRLLGYSTCQSRKLRFFHGIPEANAALENLTILMLSENVLFEVVKLDIELSQKVGSNEAGHWFLVRFDKETLSLLHLPLEDETEELDEQRCYRKLSFFTFCITDLYKFRNENVPHDDESIEDHLSEYMAVEELSDAIESAHLENYAQAAYLALRKSKTQVLFDTSDFDRVLSSCHFVTVTELYIPQALLSEDQKGSARTNLEETIETLFSAIPGNENLLYYTAEESDDALLSGDCIGLGDADSISSFDDNLSSDDEADDEAKDAMEDYTLGVTEHPTLSKAEPPIFVRFMKDGHTLPCKNLTRVANGANLTVQMSSFKNRVGGSRSLLDLPYPVANKFDALLKSYLAEQSLERMRSLGKSIEDTELAIVRKCLRTARNVLVSFFDIHFYVGTGDKMVSAAKPPHGSDAEIEEAFSIFCNELLASPDFALRRFGIDAFYVANERKGDESFEFWGFVSVKKSLGVATAEVYHPNGVARAEPLLSSLQDLLSRTCHKTNQLLLLQRLLRTRTISTFLEPSLPLDDAPDKHLLEKHSSFDEGHFSCKTVFSESYELYHRCSPDKVIQKLMSTAVHNFVVGNRHRLFVYKDEGGGIFYLKLEASTDISPECVELLVFGVQSPGESVTHNLSNLLRKRILAFAAETWSAVLRKNPQYSWKEADLEFVRTYRAQKRSFDPAEPAHESNNGTEAYFSLPSTVTDPLNLLVYFRQNLCGSTFFHRLNESPIESETTKARENKTGVTPGIECSSSLNTEDTAKGNHISSGESNESRTTIFDDNGVGTGDAHKTDYLGLQPQPNESLYESSVAVSAVKQDFQKDEESSKPDKQDCNESDCTARKNRHNEVESAVLENANNHGIMTSDDFQYGASVEFDQKEFTFFYNYVPSVLDKSVQALSTLTRRGKAYSEQTGNGIAIIEMHLLKVGKVGASATDDFRIGSPLRAVPATLSPPLKELCCSEMADPNESEGGDTVVKVIFTDTALNLDTLKRWMQMTLDQVIIAWTIERHIQRVTTGLMSELPAEQIQSNEMKNVQIENLCPGLPWMIDVLLSSKDLPHPAVHTFQFNTIMRSSSVAAHTNSLLRDCIFKELAPNSIDLRLSQTIVIRSSRGSTPKAVNPSSTCQREVTEIVGLDGDSITPLSDSPIDCPEYLCYYCFQQFSDMEEKDIADHPPMVFKEVMVGDALSDRKASPFSQRLNEVKRKLPSAFRRSFAFVLAVKRNKRSLICYNWEQTLRKEVTRRIGELEGFSMTVMAKRLSHAQRRCLGRLAPGVKKSNSILKRNAALTKTNPSNRRSDPSASSSEMSRPPTAPRRRIQRPTAIRRPKLVGKSVEGGAQQAIEAARAKARAPSIGSGRSSGEKTRARPEKISVKSTETVEQSKRDEAESNLLQRDLARTMGKPWSSSFGMTISRYRVMMKWWFRPAAVAVPRAIRDILLTYTKPLWIESCEVLTFTRLLAQDLPLQFAQKLKKLLGSIATCEIVSTSHGSPKDGGRAVFLMAALRISTMVTFLVVRIGQQKLEARKHILNCAAWLMKLPPPGGVVHRRRREGTRSIERHNTALARKVAVAHEALTNVESNLFDFSADMIFQAANMASSGKEIDESYIQLAERLVDKFTMDAQQEMLHLEYRVFNATIVLKSYEDYFIDKFDSRSLFDHLQASASNLVAKSSGTDNAAFRDVIKLYGTTTFCLLVLDRIASHKMSLIYVCKTDGTNLDDNVFPSGSNVATSIFKLVVIEGARLAYEALRSSAIDMHSNAMWERARNIRQGPQQPDEQLEELLGLVSSAPIFLLGNSLWRMLHDEALAIDTEDIFVKMSRDTCFAPNRKFRVQEDSYHRIFHINKLDSFLLFKVKNRAVTDIILLQRGQINEIDVMNCMDMFSNYLLHYLWKS